MSVTLETPLLSNVEIPAQIRIHQEDCAAWRDHTMTQLNGLDYGSGMAHSFYFGYLRLILPASGGLGKDMKDRIQSFLETQQLNDFVFPVKKLIILIPSSGHSFPTLKDDPSQTETLEPDISPVTDIDAHVQDRSGVKGRIYRAGAYRLKVTNQGKVKFLYALIEGATPLLTFREAWTHVKQLEEHRVDIVSNFYRTLHNLLNNDPECKHLVELIYYDDEVHNIVPILQKFLLDKCDKRKVFLDP